MSFNDFDPLDAKQSTQTDVAIRALKREIQNILDSYVGWYDPFCELIQNSLDSIDERITNDINYKPSLHIIINLKDNILAVTDNGIGLTKEKFESFLAPSFSFKSGNTRGYKGVGATFLGYGFNFIQISTKTNDFEAIGKMENAKKWLTDPSPSGNPKVIKDKKTYDQIFKTIDKGVSIALKFDHTTRPGNLSWLNAQNAKQWVDILSIKTGIGSITNHIPIEIKINVIDKDGSDTSMQLNNTGYFWPHKIVNKSKKLSEIEEEVDKRYKKQGADFRIPSSLKNIECIYDTISYDKLCQKITLNENENEILTKYNPMVYFAYVYSVKVWNNYNESLKIRGGQSILNPGIQIASNNMPQGEIIPVLLKRNIGRQNQIHVVVHFEDCKIDLGRKGFQKEIIEFVQSISRKLIEGPITKVRKYLRPVTGTKPDLEREQKVDDWKKEFILHEKQNPLNINNPHFFLPVNRVSISSIPTREQDVIALFNQLLAGGVIRGIEIMSTNERFTYDGMYHIIIDPPEKNHLYDKKQNPLGIVNDYIFPEKLHSSPKILEYKYSLDALLEDIDSGIKNSNDIDLVVVWETGTDYERNYHITSLLNPENLSERQYHGITHVITNISSGQREMDLIVLNELIDFLNSPDKAITFQEEKYD